MVLNFGPSLVSLSVLAWAGAAAADTTISNTVTTPVQTSTAASGAPDNVVVTGTVKVPSGAAVTLDSNNTVTVSGGSLVTQDVSNVTGILVKGGLTGAVTNAGTIQYNETAGASTNSNGVLVGPFATGSGRFGVRINGPGAFTGTINNQTGGSITIQGNNSAGVSAETDIAGSILNGGAISATGTQAYGIHTTGKVSGDVSSTGSLAATGQYAQGIVLGDDVGGRLYIEGPLTVTGYRYTTRPTDTKFLSNLVADDLLQSNAAVSVGGNLGKGFLVDAPPVLDATNTDVNGNGVADASEVAGSINNFSSAPAVVVGAAGRGVTLGNVGTGDSAYGMVNRGTIVSQGLYDGVSASGVQLGVTNGGAVDLSGGLHNFGTITAQAYAADATGLTLNSGASVAVIRNDGVLSASLASDAAGATARAVVINGGATAPAVLNGGSIAARVTGQKADAVAILDRSGSLTEIENARSISAGRVITDSTVAVTGHDIAIDVSANSTGVHLAQFDISGGATSPSISGDLMFGSGNDRLDIQAGTVSGDIYLGAGANVLNISGGATVAGRLTATGGTAAVAVTGGTLQINGTDTVSLTSLSLANNSTLVVTADPSAGVATRLNVAGTATLATGTKVGVRVTSLSSAPATFTVIQANQLVAGAIDSSQLASVPFLYNASVQADTTAGAVNVTVARKTAADLQLSQAQTAAYDSMLLAVNKDDGLRSVALAQTSRSGLASFFNQLLPNYNGAVFHVAQAAVDAFSRPLDERQDPVGGGFWIQEVNTGTFGASGSDRQGYRGIGVGAIAGYEFPATRVGVFGVTLGGSSNQIDSKGSAADQNLTANLVDAGVYWRTSRGPFSANVRLAGDYLSASSDRVATGVTADGAPVSRTATGHWSGYGVNGRIMGSYEARFGRYYLRPQVSADFLRLEEGSYTEGGGGDGMNLAVSSRTSSSASIFAGVAAGAIYGGQQNPWGPEVLVGYRNVASENLDPTSARFVSGGNMFSLQADQVGGQGAEARLAVRGENGSGGFAAEAGAQARDALTVYDLRLSAHFQF